MRSDWEMALLTFRALTPLHVGSGTSVSYVDLPIARERHTHFPVIPGSGIKGVFRDIANRLNKCNIHRIFGPEPGSADLKASAIAFTDAKILLYPVRSLRGTFALITSPMVLHRFSEELNSFGSNVSLEGFKEISLNEDEVIVMDDSPLKVSRTQSGKKVVLEEFVFEVKSDEGLDGTKEAIKQITGLDEDTLKRIAIVSDNVFTDFVRYATEVRTRIRIDQSTGTVSQGALFSMEMVPAEAIFYSFVFGRNRNENEGEEAIRCIRDILKSSNVLQLGGDETIGMGFVKVGIHLKEGKDGNYES